MDKRKSNLQVYGQSLALLTDLYQLMMAYGYWKTGMAEKEAVFHHIFRRTPFGGGFTIAAGLESLIDFIEHFHFDSSDLDYLSTLKGVDDEPFFCEEFLTYLSKLTFSCDVDAIPEGTVVFPQEPLVRVQGPLLQAQLMESPLLNIMNFPTLIATKAARVSLAAKGDSILEFGMRRAQGIDGALSASRAAYIGGCASTSHVLAGKLFGIPVAGTQAHSWIMAFEDEQESFQAFADALPGNCVFLVDTYNTLEGVKKAIVVGKRLEAQGKRFLGVRLDSGDLNYLSIQSRRLLDEAGLTEAQIFASSELDEVLIADLKRQGAKIAVWGVGTNLVTAKSQPALDGVYKLTAIRDSDKEWKYKLKLSEQIIKISNPGILQVRRFFSEKGAIADAIYDISQDVREGCTIVDPLDSTKDKEIKKGWESKDLLVPIFRKGKKVYSSPELVEIQKQTKKNLEEFDPGIKRFLNPHLYVVGMEKSLYEKKTALIRKIRKGKV